METKPQMTVEEYIEKKIQTEAEVRYIDVEEEVWNILYNLLAYHKIKAGDLLDINNAEFMKIVNSYEVGNVPNSPPEDDTKWCSM